MERGIEMDANLATIMRRNWQFNESNPEIVGEDYKGDPIYKSDCYCEFNGELFMPGDALDFVKYLGAAEVEN